MVAADSCASGTPAFASERRHDQERSRQRTGAAAAAAGTGLAEQTSEERPLRRRCTLCESAARAVLISMSRYRGLLVLTTHDTRTDSHDRGKSEATLGFVNMCRGEEYKYCGRVGLAEAWDRVGGARAVLASGDRRLRRTAWTLLGQISRLLGSPSSSRQYHPISVSSNLYQDECMPYLWEAS